LLIAFCLLLFANCFLLFYLPLMKYILTITMLFSFFISRSQTKIELSEVASHIGDSVKLEGKIFGIRSFENGSENFILVNLGAAYPNQLLTLKVYPSSKSEGTTLPGKDNVGDTAVVTGKVELYKGKPQIVVHDPGQLLIVQEKK